MFIFNQYIILLTQTIETKELPIYYVCLFGNFIGQFNSLCVVHKVKTQIIQKTKTKITTIVILKD